VELYFYKVVLVSWNEELRELELVDCCRKSYRPQESGRLFDCLPNEMEELWL
jgi:hypothetical protein